ncbi:iron ABC transporter permease [Paucibacter sp. B2R-40]|uniref:FecCD family ABC transporter permease n=1 Tax=Paucibacter sp. B2R-40 TaxID=2893554 RepID=UPI0021E41E0B|nr:iron ABC transporter permease [Paucibacter sp. B2R-40]MCV2354651.1 iron ABC transporter permease [Paucibacter sp. B2R-40]
MNRHSKPLTLLLALTLISSALLLIGVTVGSTGFGLSWLNSDDAIQQQILWQIRLPRSSGAWVAGALLGLAGAVAQGLFRNALADPYLLGASSGAGLGVALLLVLAGTSPAAASLWLRVGLTGAAFCGAVGAVLLTLVLARGVEQTMRLLLAGVIVGVVLGSATTLMIMLAPDIMRPMQAFVMGSTGFLGWNSVLIMAPLLLLCLLAAMGCSRALDAMTLGESTAASLGVRLQTIRLLLIGVLALATGAAVAQAGLIGFVGLVAPHLVRSRLHCTHSWLLLLSALTGGALLLAADILARWLVAPQELPVGVVTTVLGGAYLLWLMHRKPLLESRA